MWLPWKRNNTPPRGLPPVPDWKPEFSPNLNELIDRFSYYTDYKKGFVVLKHGTMVPVDDGLVESACAEQAKQTIEEIWSYHPDMTPRPMDDGNVLISYNRPAYNVVIMDVARNYWAQIDENHQRALCADEVLITPAGPNIFDDLGKMALWGRCYLFMDAQDFQVVEIVRKKA